MTNVEPPIPMKNRMEANPSADVTKPVSAVGTALMKRIIPIGIRGPYLSHKGPSRNRIKIVPDTAVIEEVHISSLLIFNVFSTSFRSGDIENLRRCKNENRYVMIGDN